MVGSPTLSASGAYADVMSDDPPTDESTAGTVYRTLGKPFRARRDAEMDVVGWSLFLGLLILLLPLLPILLLVWLITKVLEAMTPTEDRD
jgi:hypothetical protein